MKIETRVAWNNGNTTPCSIGVPRHLGSGEGSSMTLPMGPADSRLVAIAQYGIETEVLRTACDVLRFFEQPSRFLALRAAYRTAMGATS